ncbi:hypothetical protein JTB14_011762 [Gonioctena quinquepunctata]|nr:hypothetical protein JTB14_011762 [Gonioctena quinquepunctata]
MDIECDTESRDSGSEKETESTYMKTKNVKYQKTRKYTLCESWLQNPNFKDWQVKSKGKQKDQAFCRICKINIFAHKATITRHLESEKYKFNAKQVANTPDLSKILTIPWK